MPAHTRPRHFLISESVLAILVLLFATFVVSAQNANDIGTPAESKTGASTASSYAMDKLETVNLANGNMSLHIPLASIGGRGSSGFTIALSYNSKLWSPEHNTEVINAENVNNPPVYIEHYRATFDDFSMRTPGVIALGGGWTLLPAPTLKTAVVNIDPLPPGSSCTTRNESGPPCGYKYVLTKMWLMLPDGSEIELRDDLTNGAPALTPNQNGYHPATDRDRGRVWHSTDGSGIIYASVASGGAWIFFPDGTRYRMLGGSMQIIDRNGNVVNIDYGTQTPGYTTYTDTLGRQVLLSTNGTITVKGYNGVADRTITIDVATFGALDGSGVASNLRADVRTVQRPFYSGDYERSAEGAFTAHTDPGPHTDLFSGSEGTDGPIDEHGGVTMIHLLDGRTLRFRYNEYGELAEIVYPGGGVSQIDYAAGGSNLCEATPLADQLNRRVVQRRSLTDGVSVDAVWVYGLNGGSVEIHQGSATGTLLASEIHSFMMLNAEYRNCISEGGNGTGYEKWQNAKEYRVERQTGTGTTVELRTWEQRASVVWANDVGLSYNAYATEHGQEQPSNDPRVTVEDSILENGMMKRVEYTYDNLNNQTLVKEYDLGGTDGSVGSLARQSVRTYGAVIGSNYGIVKNGICYSNLNPADSSCGTGVASDLSSIIYQPHLLANETTKDAAGTQKAYSELEYDNYVSDTDHAALVINSGMIQYDGTQFSTFATANQPRGNVTKATRWSGGSNYISSFSQYDNAGNAVLAKDPRGNITTVSYADNFGSGSNPDSGASGANGATYAFATLATNALSQQAKSQFDYTFGTPTGAEDPNGIVSKIEYDPIGRPIRTTSALGLSTQSLAETTYPTAASNVATASKQMDSTRWFASKSILDGFDRPVTSWQAEDGQPASTASFTIRANTIYDALGRVKQVSNPYRPGASETAVYTTSAYDVAGRLVTITTPDGAVVSTYYNSNQVLVRDQAGKERMSQTNGLGQLTDVWEITASDSATESISFSGRSEVAAGYRTKYDYNTLGNLTTVTQQIGTSGTTQTRSFVYDSLSRLTSAANPESGTVGYTYDDGGNLLTKTDARSIVSTYAYDALNRPTSRSYSDGTPTVTHSYDSTSITNGIGRLSSTSSSVSSYSYSGYDALGRASGGTQTISSHSYSVGYTYDKAGDVLTETYPSERTVTNVFDNAGRETSVTGNLGDSTTRTYSTGIVYDAASRMTQEQFGTMTAIYNKLAYNSRGQLAEMRASTVGGDTSWDRGKITNDYSDQCSGASCNGTDNNGNLKKQMIFIPSSDPFAQSYTYDPLNRLQSVNETKNGGSVNWQQQYSYDRFGNRTIDQDTSHTYGSGIPKPNFSASTANNRLGVPSGLTGTMTYDSAGNLTTDTYSAAAVTRLYDAENRMTKETQAGSYDAGIYSYDGDGRRVKRIVGSMETWQVYGLGGELVAEYAANTAASTPQKEYGYRNGQLLVTATIGTGWGSAPTYTAPDPLVTGVEIKLEHLTELRTAVNQLRVHAGLTAATWTTDPTPVRYVTEVKANHILQLRTALEGARSQLGLSTGGYTHPGLTVGDPIYAIDFQELRNQIASAWVSVQVSWLVSDQLGTPRIIFDQSGSLANVSRHDYLPFGEELFAGTGGRTQAQGYVGDSTRQHFTGYERDSESGLDYAHARYYGSTQGRFTSPDPYIIFFEMERGRDASEQQEMLLEYISQPQNWAKYTYGLNNPLNHTDPTGMRPPTKFEQQALDYLEQLAAKEKDKDLAAALRSARTEIAGIIDALGKGQTSVGINVAVNAILNIGNPQFANSATVAIQTNSGTVVIGPSNKCNVFVGSTYARGAGLGFIPNGQSGRGYPLVGGKLPVANWLGDAQNRQHLSNLAIVTNGLQPGDIVAWRYSGGGTDGHSSIYIGGNVLVYAGSNDTHGVPKYQTLNYVDSWATGGYFGTGIGASHDHYVVRRYNGKP